MQKFNVTYEMITPESAEYGDVADAGFVLENATLRDALDAFGPWGHVEANECPVHAPRWFTGYGEEDCITGEVENRSLHLPDSLTNSSRIRIARLLDCYGIPA